MDYQAIINKYPLVVNGITSIKQEVGGGRIKIVFSLSDKLKEKGITFEQVPPPTEGRQYRLTQPDGTVTTFIQGFRLTAETVYPDGTVVKAEPSMFSPEELLEADVKRTITTTNNLEITNYSGEAYFVSHKHKHQDFAYMPSLKSSLLMGFKPDYEIETSANGMRVSVDTEHPTLPDEDNSRIRTFLPANEYGEVQTKTTPVTRAQAAACAKTILDKADIPLPVTLSDALEKGVSCPTEFATKINER